MASGTPALDALGLLRPVLLLAGQRACFRCLARCLACRALAASSCQVSVLNVCIRPQRLIANNAMDRCRAGPGKEDMSHQVSFI